MTDRDKWHWRKHKYHLHARIDRRMRGLASEEDGMVDGRTQGLPITDKSTCNAAAATAASIADDIIAST
jgi:hypothetical protein